MESKDTVLETISFLESLLYDELFECGMDCKYYFFGYDCNCGKLDKKNKILELHASLRSLI